MVSALAAGPAPLALDPGPHSVGFRVFNHRDASRRLADGSLRPVQVSVWYPATDRASGPTVTYRDYVLVAARAKTLAPLSADGERQALEGYRAFLGRNGVPASGVDEWLAAPMLAHPDAPSAAGRYPVVLVGQGMGGAVQDQAALGESLASHGYVVATTPSPVRLGTKMESEADVPAMAEEQARDLEVALAVVAPRGVADPTQVAVIGYSFGARPALLLAGRHPSWRALVSLDGGIGSAEAKGWLAPRALDRGALHVPILHVYEEEDENARPDFELLSSLVHAPRTLARAAGLRHLDFITFGLASATLPALGGADSRRAATLRAVFALTRGFLDAHVAGRSEAWPRAVDESTRGGQVRVSPFGSRPAAAR
ncbi:MAG TPA: dienelactone hydrolase family protein [Vicinamibacteria bacterium]|nr:dienelactone hydrolase family protein [Vicinamibacteria bacterium]